MSFGQVEKIDDIKWLKTTKRMKKCLKKATHKRNRIDGKKMLDDAPKKNKYKGWST